MHCSCEKIGVGFDVLMIEGHPIEIRDDCTESTKGEGGLLGGIGEIVHFKKEVRGASLG